MMCLCLYVCMSVCKYMHMLYKCEYLHIWLCFISAPFIYMHVFYQLIFSIPYGFSFINFSDIYAIVYKCAFLTCISMFYKCDSFFFIRCRTLVMEAI